MEIKWPVTIVECPNIKVASIKFYKNSQPLSEIFSTNLDKELARAIILPKKIKNKIEDIKDFDDIRILCYTQPKLIGLKKKPDIFEAGLGGNKEQKLEYAKNILGKEISVSDILKEGMIVDAHAVTKGKGFQGPVKRFGIALKSHKSEKGRRQPGSLGGWRAQGHVMYRVPHAGQMGFQTRTDYNKLIVKIGHKPEEINQNGGLVKYGVITNNYILIKGTISGSRNRFIRLVFPIKPPKKRPELMPITYISTSSKQGR